MANVARVGGERVYVSYGRTTGDSSLLQGANMEKGACPVVIF